MRLYIVLIIAVILFTSCGTSTNKEREKQRMQQMEANRLDSLAFKVAVMPTLDCLPLFVAKERGLFEAVGLDVSLKQKNAQMDCEEAFRNNEVECFVSDLMRTERIKRQGHPLDYLTSTNASWQMIGNHKARINEIKNLGDKLISMARFSSTDYLSTLAIDSVKPEHPVFRIQVNDVLVRLMMLLNNEIDAAMLTEPQATVARQSGHKVLMDSRDKDIYLGVFAIQGNLSANPYRKQQLEKFSEVYNMACDSINEKGFVHYSSIIEDYCKVKTSDIRHLPKIRFNHISSPRQKDLSRTSNINWRTS